MARYCPLFSGSSGNCCYIGSAAGGVLVDAGVSARRIETALWEREIDPGSIRAICVTHEHSDHVAGLRVLTRRYGMPVFASRGTLEELLHAGILGERDAFAVIDEEGIEVADMEITAFPTPHDSAESLGFRIHTADDRRIAVATDMGYMTPVVRKALRGCDLVHIESNHDKKRILAKTGHLSNEACAAELPQFAQEGTTRFVLAHLSAENNLPDLAYVTSQAALQEAGLRAGVDFLLQVAERVSTEKVTVF